MSTSPQPIQDPEARSLAVRLAAARHRFRQLPGGAFAWRFLITVVGATIVGAGILLLPLPGPGWLIIFAGLGVLATEYAWAHHLLHRTRGAVRSWTRWSMRQNNWVRGAIGLGGLVIVSGALFASWQVSQLV